MARNSRGAAAAVLLFGMMSCFVGILKDSWQIHGHTTIELQRTMRYSDTVFWSWKGSTVHAQVRCTQKEETGRDCRFCMSRIDALSLFAKLVFLGCSLRLDPASDHSEEPHIPRSSVLRYPSCSLDSLGTASVLGNCTEDRRKLACNVPGLLSISFMLALTCKILQAVKTESYSDCRFLNSEIALSLPLFMWSAFDGLWCFSIRAAAYSPKGLWSEYPSQDRLIDKIAKHLVAKMKIHRPKTDV